MTRGIDMTGVNFNGCKVLKRKGTNKDKKITWLCECYCGNLFVTTGKSIRNNTVKSCGCLKQETLSKCRKNNKTHGDTGSELYNIWRGIKKRCRKPNAHNYKWYGKRGIDVCDEWYNSYSKFKEWAKTNGYEEGSSIDRINVNGNYEPNNCRWVDMKTQQRNRRNNVKVKYKGRNRTLAEISEITGLSQSLINYRYKHGVDFDAPKRTIKESDLKE
ncbi:hypothetical protein ABC558_10935 [Staphylococcus epidermidis]|uniref:hypothetical protein n=2 Tax=Staphylococcus epidermidis TaxID=1282 RepID=UPI0032049CA0